jgi:hypothetical protein
LEKLKSCTEIEDKSILLFKKGIIYGKLGDKFLELENYKEAFRMNPNNTEVRLKLSDLYEDTGDHKKAKNILQIEDFGDLSITDEEDFEVFLSDDDTPHPAGQTGNFGGKNAPGQSFLGKRVKSRANKEALGKKKRKDSDLDYVPLDNHAGAANNRHRASGNWSQSKFSHFGGTEGLGDRSELFKKIKTEQNVNFKTKKRLKNLIEFNSNFFSEVDREINQILFNYDMDTLTLGLKKNLITFEVHQESLEALLSIADTSSTENFSDKFLKFLIESKNFVVNCLKLELERENLESTIYNILLKESKGKILANFKDEKYKDELSFIYIFKKRKDKFQDNLSKYFQKGKHKSKIASRLSKIVISKMKTIISSSEKENFIQIADKTLVSLYKLKKYRMVAEVCQFF